MTSVNASLDPRKSVKTGDRLDPKKQRLKERETIQKTESGFPGLRARKLIEKYKDEEGVETHEYRMEVVLLGKTFTLEQGEAKYDESDDNI